MSISLSLSHVSSVEDGVIVLNACDCRRRAAGLDFLFLSHVSERLSLSFMCESDYETHREQPPPLISLQTEMKNPFHCISTAFRCKRINIKSKASVCLLNTDDLLRLEEFVLQH